MSVEKILDLLSDMKEESLAVIDGKIAEVQKQLDSLVMIRRVIDTKINGKRPAAVAAKTKPAVKKVPSRDLIAKYLLSSGTAKIGHLTDVIDAENGRTTAAYLRHPWFKQSGDYWSLTDLGKAEAAKL